MFDVVMPQCTVASSEKVENKEHSIQGQIWLQF